MEMNRRVFLGASALGMTAASSVARAKTASNGKLRACVIGDTKQGQYGHSLHMAWSTRDDVEVVGLADPDEEGRKKHAADAQAQRSYADYREMLDKEKPDLVSVGPRWTIHHREYLLAAAACGAHGFMEKPLAVDLTEADEMISMIDAKNLKWSIAFNFRASPVVQHARRLIMDEGLIGEVLELRGRGKEDRRAGGEDLMVLGTHTFDMMRFFLGDPQWCEARILVDGRAATREDVREATEPLGPVLGNHIEAAYGFPNGITAYFASKKNVDGNQGRWGLDIYGTKGIVSIRMNIVPYIYLLRDPTWAPGRANTDWEMLPDAPEVVIKNHATDANAPIIDDLLAAIDADRRPQVSLHDGRSSLEMILAVYAAYLNGGRIALPLVKRDHPLKG